MKPIASEINQISPNGIVKKKFPVIQNETTDYDWQKSLRRIISACTTHPNL